MYGASYAPSEATQAALKLALEFAFTFCPWQKNSPESLNPTVALSITPSSPHSLKSTSNTTVAESCCVTSMTSVASEPSIYSVVPILAISRGSTQTIGDSTGG
jgi:hypothetical protein